LIDANVFMEADNETRTMDVWPPELRDNADELDKCNLFRSVFAFLRLQHRLVH
jgi:hypothetical protein